MPTRTAHHQLLFGLLALQNGFVNQTHLIAAFGVWSLEKSRSLEEILLEQKALDESGRSLLHALVKRHLENHAQDAEQSLAALPALGEVRARLNSIADPDLGASLMRLRGAELASNGTLNEPAVTQAIPTASAGGRFVVLRPHARGGLGKVSVALDSELNRQVALKEIREEYAHDQYNQSRFVQEAEITGQLEHPGIVPVYGLGAYRDGRPYYAMRFVEGESLKRAIELFHERRGGRKMLTSEQAVSFRNLLGRFVAACHAIEYAHSRNVIHRDLKPENIMLGPYGETLVVDWGLAKSLDAAVADRADETGTSQLPVRDLTSSNADTLPNAGAKPVKLKGGSSATPTLEGSALGTPAYMSPEQAVGKLAELGPASDVYGLGATLYVLLTGQAAFKGDDVAELLDKVRFGQFPSPRSIWSGAPRALEAICLKAMSLKSADRYRSATKLAEDVERYLADEPVMAFPDPVLVRCRRWMKRRPGLVAGVAATVVLGMTSAVTLAALSQQHASQLELKNQTISGQLGELQRRNETIEKQNDTLAANNATISKQKNDLEVKNASLALAWKEQEQAVDRAEKVTEFLVKMFESVDPDEQGKDIKVADLLDKQAAAFVLDFEQDGATRAAVLSAIGSSYDGLGDSAKAIPLHQLALKLRREQLGDDAIPTIVSMNLLGNALTHEGQFEAAIPILEEAIERSRKQFGEKASRTLTAQSNLCHVYSGLGQYTKSLPLAELILKLRLEATPDDDGTLFAMNDAALAYSRMDRPLEAIPLFEEAHRKLVERFGKTHPESLICLGNLADAYRKAGQQEKGLETQQQVVAGRMEKLGEDHPQTLYARNNLALSMQNLERYDEAAATFSDVLIRLTKRFGDSHPEPLITKINLANCYLDLKEEAKAIPLFEEALATAKQDPIKLASRLVYAARTYGGIYYNKREYGKAIEIYRQAEEPLAKTKGAPPQLLFEIRSYLGNALRESGELDQAIALLESVQKGRAEVLGADHAQTLFVANNLALAYQFSGRLDEAIRLFESAHHGLREKFEPEHTQPLICQQNLGTAYFEAGRLEEAELALRNALDLREQQTKPDEWRIAHCLAELAQVYLVQKRYQDAKPLIERCIALREKSSPNNNYTIHAKALLGWAAFGLGVVKPEDNLRENPLVYNLAVLLSRIDDLPQGFGPKMIQLNEQVVALGESVKNEKSVEFSRKQLEELKLRYSTGKRR